MVIDVVNMVMLSTNKQKMKVVVVKDETSRLHLKIHKDKC